MNATRDRPFVRITYHSRVHSPSALVYIPPLPSEWRWRWRGGTAWRERAAHTAEMIIGTVALTITPGGEVLAVRDRPDVSMSVGLNTVHPSTFDAVDGGFRPAVVTKPCFCPVDCVVGIVVVVGVIRVDSLKEEALEGVGASQISVGRLDHLMGRQLYPTHITCQSSVGLSTLRVAEACSTSVFTARVHTIVEDDKVIGGQGRRRGWRWRR